MNNWRRAITINSPRVLLVAKPWRGGLARYLYLALNECFPGAVEWLPTYPVTLTDTLRYRANKTHWRERRVERIRASRAGAVIFLNPSAILGELDPQDHYVAWITDDPTPTLPWLPQCGRVFISDAGYAEPLRRALGTPRYAGVLPFAHHPALHTPQPQHLSRDVCFIANRDAKRDDYLAHLFARDFPVTVYGNYYARHPLFWQHWRNFRPTVSNDALGAIYARYRASLNIHAAVVKHGTNMRSFECAGYGIPQLVEYRPGLEDLFEPENEILTFTTTDELIAQWQRLAHDAPLAQRLATQARHRALAEHTYAQRVRVLLNGLLALP